ncbi:MULTISPECIES: MerR family transcriptional regulator [Sphingobium]|uniref:MerR family transcriptional regulator n=1 Tax=Sphingobium TaxID=165695 RepID=UPI00159C6E71|nr:MULTISPECIES: MerR family transcriptional regulator [unclassified Sphingobium]
MKMRELEERTGVDREVIRILIREGLLPQPERPARNAAEYDENHVRGIAAVRELQKGARLTIKQIKALMNGDGGQPLAPSSPYAHLEQLLSHRFGLDTAPTVSLASLQQRHSAAERDAQAFAQMDMLDMREGADGPELSLPDARLVEIWGRIREAGFVDENGFPPENIAFYKALAEQVAAHEAAIFFNASDGRIEEEKAAAMLHTALPLMLDFFGLLRIKAFMRLVNAATSPDAAA